MDIGIDQGNGSTDDLDSHMKYVATKTERLIFCWPIKGFSERTNPANTQSYHFMEENLVNMVQWRMEVSNDTADPRTELTVTLRKFHCISDCEIALELFPHLWRNHCGRER